MDKLIQIAVKADPATVWSALTDADTTPAYYYGFRAEFDLSEGAEYRYTAGGGDVITGKVLALEPGRRIEMTFNGLWTPEVATLPETTVTFALGQPPMPLPGVTVLACLHEGLPDAPIATELESGWVTILSGLKTLLETGSPL